MTYIMRFLTQKKQISLGPHVQQNSTIFITFNSQITKNSKAFKVCGLTFTSIYNMSNIGIKCLRTANKN